MLRFHLGDEVFWSAVRLYLQRFKFKTVETNDFRATMEEVSGKSLVKFFEQWFERPGYPKLKVAFEYNAKEKTGTFHVEQTLKDQMPFILKTQVAWHSGVEGLQVRTIEIDTEKRSYSYSMTAEPNFVQFDPYCVLVHAAEFDPGRDMLIKQLHQSNVIGRIHAAHTLAKSGRREDAMAIADAYKKEKFWGAKREMAEAIADMYTSYAREWLAATLLGESDAMVLETSFELASDLQGEQIADSCLQRLRRGDLGYRAAAWAWHALGRQRESAPLNEMLAASKKVDLQHGFEQAGALRGMAISRQTAALDHLVSALKPGGQHYRSRAGAAAGLGILARTIDRGGRAKIQDALSAAMQDEHYWVRQAAAQAIVRGGFVASKAELQAYGRALPKQERVVVDAWLDGLADPDHSAVATAEDKVRDLEEKLRKLTDRLDKLESSKKTKVTQNA
jgi:aminopeptidase N